MRINRIDMNVLSTAGYMSNRHSNFFKTNDYPFDKVTFSSKFDSQKVKDNITDGLAVIGFVGTPLVCSILLGNALAKHIPQDDNIFLSDGTYVCNVKDFQLESSKVFADADDGILKIKDSPIDIDASKVDYADPLRGIYKNFDGSVDIDLLHQKYIDTNNGIFVDVPNGISKIADNGQIKDMPLINFEGSSMSGPNHPFPPYHLDSDIMNDGLLPTFVDNIKNTVNILFKTNMPTGYIVDENGTKMPMKEWLKEHDTLNRDFNTQDDQSSFKDYAEENDLPISVDEDGQVSLISEPSQNVANIQEDDSANTDSLDNSDYDYDDPDSGDYDPNY